MWNLLESDEVQSKARDSLREILAELQSIDTSEMSAFALCEQALLFAYIGLDRPAEHWHEKVADYLNLAIERLFLASTSRNGLYGGLAGIGWLVQHIVTIVSTPEICSAELYSNEEEDVLSEVDTHLLRQLNLASTGNYDYDLVSGIVGMGIYWLERLPRRSAIHAVHQTVLALELSSERNAAGTTWFTPPHHIPATQKDLAPDGYYNLGVAHGVPGVIAFLSQAASLNLTYETTRKASILLESSVEWLFVQQRSPRSVSRYSSWTSSKGDCGDSRLAWCYGDLGIAAILELAARSMHNPVWSSHSNGLAKQCIARGTEIETSDAALCHGALGIAHIYQRLYQTHRVDAYKQAAADWALKGMAMRDLGTGVAGYYAWDSARIPCKYMNLSFLSGAVGVALALLSLISSQEPGWDRMMLLSGIDPAICGTTLRPT